MSIITKPYQIKLETPAPVLPDSTVSEVATVLDVFCVQKAEPVPGIKYEDFEVRSLAVGQTEQWRDSAPRPVKDLFICLRRAYDKTDGADDTTIPLDPCVEKGSISMVITNTSDKPSNFAIMLTGIALKRPNE